MFSAQRLLKISLYFAWLIAIRLLNLLLFYKLSRKNKREDVSTKPTQELDLLKQENESLQKQRSENDELINTLKDRIAQLDKELSESLDANVDDSLGEIEKKFKRKISELEDELEEKNDDFDDLKKKSKKVQNELQEQIDNALREKKRISAELEKVSEKQIKLQLDVTHQKQSLSFIQEILSARPISDASIVGLEKRIDKIKDYIRKNRHLSDVPHYDPNQEAIYDITHIEKSLPHKYPFLLVDKIIELSDDHVVGIKNVTFNEHFFQGHFPGNPVMPGVLQIEALAQTGGILALNNYPNPENYDTYFLKIDKVKFKQRVVPGDTLVLKLELQNPIRRGI